MIKGIKISQVVGIALILAAFYGFSPWIPLVPASIVQVGPVTIKDIPPYDAIRIGISSILLFAGIIAIKGKMPF